MVENHFANYSFSLQLREMVIKAVILWEVVTGMVLLRQKIMEMAVQPMVEHHLFPLHLLQLQVALLVLVPA